MPATRGRADGSFFGRLDMTKSVGHNGPVESYDVDEAKTRLAEILGRVSEGEEILLTRRGKPIARLVPAGGRGANILGAGRKDPNLNPDALAADQWWQPLPEDESKLW